MIGKGLWKRTHKLPVSGAELDTAVSAPVKYMHTIIPALTVFGAPVACSLVLMHESAEPLTEAQLIQYIKDNDPTVFSANYKYIPLTGSYVRFGDSTVEVYNGIGVWDDGEDVNIRLFKTAYNRSDKTYTKDNWSPSNPIAGFTDRVN